MSESLGLFILFQCLFQRFMTSHAFRNLILTATPGACQPQQHLAVAVPGLSTPPTRDLSRSATNTKSWKWEAEFKSKRSIYLSIYLSIYIKQRSKLHWSHAFLSFENARKPDNLAGVTELPTCQVLVGKL